MNIILEHLSKNAGKHANKTIDTINDNFNCPDDIEEFFDLEFMDGKGNTLAADMYRPKMQNGSLLPVIIFSHGGGLFVGTKRMNRLFCEIISRMGFVVYSLDYRLIDKADGLEEISDICAAFRFIKENLHEHGGDPEKIFVCGESSGVYLSLYATALLKCSSLREKLQIEVPELDVKGLICFSGLFYTTRKDPIGMVYKKDLYGKKLEKEGHPVKLVYYSNSRHLIHAFPSLAPLAPETAAVMTLLKKWMNDVLKKEE